MICITPSAKVFSIRNMGKAIPTIEPARPVSIIMKCIGIILTYGYIINDPIFNLFVSFERLWKYENEWLTKKVKDAKKIYLKSEGSN